MRVGARSLLSPVAPLLFVACSAAPPPTPTPTPPPPPPGPQIQTPATWSLRPPTETSGYVDLGKEGVLHFGSNGDRWLVVPGEKTPKFATTFASDTIVSGRKLADGTYRFVTSGGALHDAPTALGALSPARTAASSVRSITVGKQAVVAIERGRTLVRSQDGGQKWEPITLPAPSGLLAQVELGDDGVGLALASPQKLFATSDDGATWREVPPPAGLGPAHLEPRDGKVELASGPNRFRFDGKGFERSTGRAAPPAQLTAIDHPNTAWASGVAGSRAALVDDKLYELVWDDDSPEPGFKLFVSELGKPESQKLLRTFACASPYLGAADKTIVVGCNGPNGPDGEKMPEDASTLVYKSEDGGATFKPDGWLTNAGRSDERLWVGPDGTVIYKNVCPVGRSCFGSGSVRVAGSSTWSELEIEGGASLFALAFGAQGNVYAVGSASDNEEGYRRAFLFVSRDNGRKFTRVVLPEPTEEQADAMRPGLGRFGPGGYSGYGDRAGAIAIGDDGKLAAVAVAYQGTWRLYGTGDDGATVALRTAPPLSGLGFAGLRGFAVGGGKAWETFDAGQTWKSAAGPGVDGGGVACTTRGCLVGSNAARLGWDLTAARGDYVPEKKPTPKQVFRTPLECKPEGEWVEVAGRGDVSSVGAELGGLWAVPMTDEETKGLSLAVFTTDAKSGALKVENVTLLAGQPKPKAPPAPAKKDTKPAAPAPWIGTRIGLVPGGAIAMRWKIDYAARKKAEEEKKPVPLGDVEVAYWSSATKKVTRGKIAKIVDREPSFELLGVTDKGAVVTRNYPAADAKLWVVGATKTETLPLPFRAGGANWRSAARVDGKLVVQQYTSGSGLEWWWEATKDPKAKPAKDAPPPPAWVSSRSVVWTDSSVGGLTYPRTTPLGPDALLFAWSANESIDAGSLALRLGPKPEASIVQGPTQLSLADKACGKDAPTAAAPLGYTAGSRHPLKLSIDNRTIVTATAEAIVRVAPDGSGCTAGRLMERNYQAGQLDALVPAADGAKGIVLRRDWKKLQAATLTCVAKPGPLPPELTGHDGFHE